MATNSEIGISPVLLQAINHTLSTNRASQRVDNGANEIKHVVIAPSEKLPDQIKMENEGHNHDHILHGMNEPIGTVSEPGETIYIVQNVEMNSSENGEYDISQVKDETTSTQRQQVYLKSLKNVEDPNCETVNTTELNAGSVLSAIASRVKVTPHRTANEENQDPNAIKGEGQPLIVSYNGTTSVPSQTTELPPAEFSDSVVTETVEVQTSSSPVPGPDIKRLRLDLPEMVHNGTTLIMNPEGFPEGTILQTLSVQSEPGALICRSIQMGPTPLSYKTVNVISSQDVLVSTVVANAEEDSRGPCPVCHDKISGYHYGIYSCESCKGFFKRTVQNKKTFICHRQGECEIDRTTRKKCPACRFTRCLVAGMKLEAIREDRTRGGRSSYSGCSPHGRVRGVETYKDKEPGPSLSNYIKAGPLLSKIVVSSGNKSQNNVKPVVTSDSSSDVDRGVSTNPVNHSLQPVAERLSMDEGDYSVMLDELVISEVMMADEEHELACCEGKLVEGDTDLFRSLLHFADHCLYKIVRWARNLPDFSSISTDDQIVLLQNCWAELLCLCCCWKSLDSLTQEEGEICLPYGRRLTYPMAKELGLGDLLEKLVHFAQRLRALEIDRHEFVALKVLVLLSPDVNNLKDEDAIHKYQEELLHSLMNHSAAHYPQYPNKVCELLARLAETTKVCSIGKDLLVKRQAAGDIPQHSLLSELLKGDIQVGVQ